MDNVGAEVGQKMRSAIKAKLLELSCYVDDELPDYIMVMVANRRTKSQMNEDLNLFLNTKTTAFVEWLHIVLKKLKEVTVTNPEVYKKVAKRKSTDQADVKVKKEKLKQSENVKKETSERSTSSRNSDHESKNNSEENTRDEFDIPLLSEVNSSNERDLAEIEAKIRNVKSRLGLMVDSDVEEEVLKIKLEKAKLEIAQHKDNTTQKELEVETAPNNSNNEIIEQAESSSEETSYTPEKPKRHSPITFERDDYPKTPPRKSSVLSRLGKRVSSTSDLDSKRKRLNFSDSRKEDESNFKRNSSRNDDNGRHNSREDRRYRRDRNERCERDRREGRRSSERRNSRSRRGSPDADEFSKRTENKSVLSRIGVMSKIHIPEKTPEEPEIQDELKTREVRSMVQVRPRVLPSDAPQPSKNLLLKAVAEANKSVSESKLGNVKTALKKSDVNEDVPITRKLSHREKVKLRNLILAQVSLEDSDSNGEDKDMVYVPKPLTKRNRQELPEYVPSSRRSIDDSPEKEKPSIKTRLSAKARLEGRKSPSPIIFDKVSTKISNKIPVPEVLHVVHPPTSVKTQERCKYWPNCRQGDKCEFIHPATVCEKFPGCKYGDKCLYLHPSCKFGAACTKRECPYSHSSAASAVVKPSAAQPQTCKYFPKCANITCPFYHPKLCKFGKYCKNQADCTFSHIATANKTSLTWRSK